MQVGFTIVSLIFVFSSAVSIPWVFFISFCQSSVNLTSLCQGYVVGAVANIYLTNILGFGKVCGALRNGHLIVNANLFHITDNCSGVAFASDRIRDPIVHTSFPCLRDSIFHQWSRHVFWGMSLCVIYACIYLTSWYIYNNQGAQANGFVAALTNNEETKMGLLHAAYGDYSLSVILYIYLHCCSLYSQV